MFDNIGIILINLIISYYDDFYIFIMYTNQIIAIIHRILNCVLTN